MALIEDEIRALALSNIAAVLRDDARTVGIDNQEKVGTALAVLQHLEENCPTCPYLDSLEDEDEDFCECGAEDGTYTEKDHEALKEFVAAQIERDALLRANREYDSSLGTYLIFCKN